MSHFDGFYDGAFVVLVADPDLIVVVGVLEKALVSLLFVERSILGGNRPVFIFLLGGPLHVWRFAHLIVGSWLVDVDVAGAD